MCLAMPCKVLEVKGDGRARVGLGGVVQEVSTLLVPDVKVGDYVLVYLGSATARIREEEAVEALRLYREMVDIEMVEQISGGR